ncbi:hypothetical protein [Methylobacterium sp. Leaf118]|uniref:hypothetical protein n=1 Tax=Methylobacterium sp. Leaf118 TaxID=2876562 RepID=UPI001E4F7F26|nr:hypothetical protein [Methylobacterium sp. Leaf118]
MKCSIGLAAALLVGAAAMATPALAQQGANTTQMTGSNATGVQPEGSMSGSKMSGSGAMKSKKMKSKKNRM